MTTKQKPNRSVDETAQPRQITNGTTRETYDGVELRHTSTRPGAYEAYEKPSLHMGQLIKPREIKP